MARDEGLEEILREDLGGMSGLTEKAMFGGWAWLLDGNLLCAARDDGMLARLGKDRDGWALDMPDVVPMISRGRRMQGWVRAGPSAFGDDALRRRLVDAALAFVRSLPAK
ncbi:MAG: TfoX/Sxy family protein [Paracoccus sp. (in: a-proteobacteria)]|uniref:TfoX/Sxy family protein n=1 Tax=Paracoccus sp. TaxID=267 RepID=UPI0026E063B6|nr:TfoX/Sxy family protein [Paracoccus sp. (in: a-proteobacteria)]MDO5622363.1 TfoX/Sxy family protein [Paracoccus sp. (in: a-proteobacteria)]